MAHPDMQVSEEVQVLDNEVSMLTHKLDQLRDKDTYLT